MPKLLPCFLFLLGLSSLVHAQAPANDDFISRIDLGGTSSVSTTGSNVNATLEVDENDLDSLGGRSVWWKWTAPASGYVSVDTAGSGFDTVLAVLADGPTLEDAFVVGFNDETGAPGAPFGSSRVVFPATAGTEYHIAVHGLLGEQGPVVLNLQAGVAPPLRLVSFTLSATSVDVTTATQFITADVGVSSDANFASGNIALHRANFSGTTNVPFLPANLLSGFPTNGIYRVSLPIPRYSEPGTWSVEIALSDSADRTIVFGRGVSANFEYDHVLPEGTPGLFAVSNVGAVDFTAPTLASFSTAPLVANVVANPADLTFTFRLTDDLSGFFSGTLTLLTPSGEALLALPIGPAQRASGTELDGTYSVPFTLPAKMPGGTWSPELLLRDAVGNAAFFEAGTANQLNVTGAPNSYWSWLYPSLSGQPRTLPQEDMDSDGISNLLEFAFAMSPKVNDSADSELRPGLDASGLPSFGLTGNTLTLTYVRRKASTNSGLTYLPQFTSSLLPNEWLSAGGGSTVSLSDFFERFTIADSFPASRRFGQVRIVLAE